VAGEKRGGTRWVYRAAVSRDTGLSQIARWVIAEFVREPEDRRHLVLAALRMVGFVLWAPPRLLRGTVPRAYRSPSTTLARTPTTDRPDVTTTSRGRRPRAPRTAAESRPSEAAGSLRRTAHS
jgi:hypothetical protein